MEEQDSLNLGAEAYNYQQVNRHMMLNRKIFLQA